MVFLHHTKGSLDLYGIVHKQYNTIIECYELSDFSFFAIAWDNLNFLFLYCPLKHLSGNITEETEIELKEFIDYAKIMMGTFIHEGFAPPCARKTAWYKNFFDRKIKKCGSPLYYGLPHFVVRVMGLEPIRYTTHAPQTCLSASSSTLANKMFSIQ